MTRFSLGRLGHEEWAKWRSFRSRHRSRPTCQFNDLVGLEADRLSMNIDSTYTSDREPMSDQDGDLDGHADDPILLRARLRIKRAWQGLGIWGPHFEHFMTGGAGTRGAEETGTSTEGPSWLLPPAHESRVDIFHQSRPINIFRHQVLDAGKMLLGEMPTRRGRYAAGDFSDIKPVAYHLVRSQWEERGIWLDCWDELPGNLWGHEIPTEQWYSDAVPGGRQSRSLPRAEVKRNIMASYRRRLRKIKRRVRWVPAEDGVDVDCQNEDDASSSTDSCDSLETRVGTFSWKLHVRRMQRQERLAFQVSRAVRIAEESEMQTAQGLPAHDSELEKQALPLVEREVKSPTEELAQDHHTPMCLGTDCVVRDSALENLEHGRVMGMFSKTRMPGIFPGDLEQYQFLVGTGLFSAHS